MRILIIGLTKLKYMPYLNFYLNNIHSSNQVHVCYWNRDEYEEDLSVYSGVTLHEFKCFQNDFDSFANKIRSFLKYRKFIKKVDNEVNPDFVIFLHTPAGIIAKPILKVGKYIYDYRDSTYERFWPYQRMVYRLVKDSYYTFVSSDAFRQFLPRDCEEKIVTSHNLLEESLTHRYDRQKGLIHSQKIRLAFWGFIRHEEINKVIIDNIGVDSRFELHYYGREQGVGFELRKYVAEKKYDNIFFHGEYIPSERYEFIKQTDLIHNLYFDSNTMLAMGNKYYDGLIFGIPLVCMRDSYMGKRATINRVGIECDPYDADFCDKLYSYYESLDWNDFYRNTDAELQSVMAEYMQGAEIIKLLR